MNNMNTEMEPDKIWIDTPEGKWTVLSAGMLATSIIGPIGSYLMIYRAFPTEHHPVLPMWVYYGIAAYFLIAAAVCLYNLKQVKR